MEGVISGRGGDIGGLMGALGALGFCK